MINTVTVTNNRGESIKLELRRPEKSGLAVSNITGLGPGDATIATSDSSSLDGATFNGARKSTRNIVFSLIFYGEGSIEEKRHATYKYFPIKKKVTLKFETDIRTCIIEGYVESNEPEIFSSLSGCDISIICPNPYFYAPDLQTSTFYSIDPEFEFEFSNESLTESLLQVSTINHDSERLISYVGDEDAGLLINMYFSGGCVNPKISKIMSGEVFGIDTEKVQLVTGSPIAIGDRILISTESGNKYARLIRDGETYNILNCVTKDSSWITIQNGDNLFAYLADSGRDNMSVTLQNKILYEGV